MLWHRHQWCCNGSLNMQFTHALIAGGKPLGEDAKYTDDDGEVISLAGARAQVGFTDEEGKMTFTFTDEYGRPILKDDGITEMSIQIDDVQDLIIPKNPDIIEGFTAYTNASTYRKLGYDNPTLAYDQSQTNNFIDTTVTDKNSYLSAINHSSGDMTTSLMSALNGVTYDGNGNPVVGSTEMSDFFWEQLSVLGGEWDTDGVDGITAEDFNNKTYEGKANFEILKDEVLSGKDINLGRQLLKANTNAQNEKHHADGVQKFLNKPKTRSNRTYSPSMIVGVDDDLGGTDGITKAAATKMAQTMQGKGTSYAGKNVKYVNDGKNNTTLFFRVPNAEKTAYEWVKQDEMSTNDALIMRGLDGLGVGYENIEQVVDGDGDGISDFIQRPLEFTTYTPSATDTPPATEPVNSGAGEGTKENPINLKEKGGNFEEGNWYIRDNGKTSLWTKRGWAKEKK